MATLHRSNRAKTYILTQTRSYRNVLTNRNGGERGVAYFCSRKLFASMLQCETENPLCLSVHACMGAHICVLVCACVDLNVHCLFAQGVCECLHVCTSAWAIFVWVYLWTGVCECVHELRERVHVQLIRHINNCSIPVFICLEKLREFFSLCVISSQRQMLMLTGNCTLSQLSLHPLLTLATEEKQKNNCNNFISHPFAWIENQMGAKCWIHYISRKVTVRWTQS